ncbi:MAG: hypothetical protein NC223_12290 [Butyrivibrio sp.]|nr:hypothetical protein [Butyrivibrio sp.]
MCKHLVVYVKASELQEFVDLLDSKGWAVIDVEPRTKFWFFFSFVLSYTIICEYVGDTEAFEDFDSEEYADKLEDELDGKEEN